MLLALLTPLGLNVPAACPRAAVAACTPAARAAPAAAAATAGSGGLSAAAAIAAFWSQVVETQKTQTRREATLPIEATADAALVLEYMNSCAHLCRSDACSVTLPATEQATADAAIRVVVEPTAASSLEPPPSPAREAAASTTREAALEQMMTWFTGALMACEIGDIDADADDAATDDETFVALGRSLLHTKSSEVTFAPTVQEMHADLWRLVAESDYLLDGSGGARTRRCRPHPAPAGVPPRSDRRATPLPQVPPSSSPPPSPTLRYLTTSACLCARGSATSSRPRSRCTCTTRSRGARGCARQCRPFTSISTTRTCSLTATAHSPPS